MTSGFFPASGERGADLAFAGSVGPPHAHPAPRELTVMSGPSWSLRVEGRRVAVVLQRASLPGGAELAELVVNLPHVAAPFDFREGIERFRHHRGRAEELEIRIEARVVLDWLHRVSGGVLGGTACDDALVLSGKASSGTRFTARARLVPDREGRDGRDGREGRESRDLRDGRDGNDEPLLALSLYEVRVYGPVQEPWPVLAGRLIDLLPKELVVDRTLTTARLKFVRYALAWALSELGWKLPDLAGVDTIGLELRDGRFCVRFASPDRSPHQDIVALTGEGSDPGVRTPFERFVEDLELKRHHGQVDRLLASGQLREALAEIYRALDGPPRPGFLAERLIGICASQPILYDEGERACRDLLAIRSTYEPALCGLASIALGRGRPEEAAIQLERLAVALTAPGDREDATATDLALADCLRAFAPDEARVALGRVLERSPDHEEALSELIALAETDGDPRAALPLYKRLLFAARSKTRTRDAGLRLARFALDRGEVEDARVLLRVVLEAAPDDLEALLALAEVEAHEGHGAEALRILEQALRAVPPTDASRLVRVILRLARLLLDALADPARARRALWRAGDLARIDDADALALGELALRAREPALAMRFTEPIGVGAAEWARAQAIRAEAHLAKGDPQAALRSALEVLKREPDHDGALALLERCAPDPAERQWLVSELYESALRAASGEPRARVLHRVAVLYLSLGLRWDAMEPLGQALFEAPASALFEARAELLMSLQAEFGLWAEHQRVGGQRLAAMKPAAMGDSAARESRVDVLTRLGRAALHELFDPLGARVWLEEATRISPRHGEAHELYAEALEAVGLSAVPTLIGVLSRLETLRPDELGKDQIRLRMAELQADVLRSPGQARATLMRLSPRARDGAEAFALRRRVGLEAPLAAVPQAAPPPVAPLPARSVAAAVMPPEELSWNEALSAADAGDTGRARAILERLLAREPGNQAARDLLGMIGPEEAPRAVVVPVVAPVVAPPRAPPVVAAPVPAPEPDPEPDPEPELVRPVAEPDAAMAPGIAKKIAEMEAIEAGLTRATEHFFADDLVGARQALSEVLAVDADVVPALEMLAEILKAQGEHAERATLLERLLASVFDGTAVATYARELGLEREALGELPAADAAFARYLRLQPLDETIFGRVRDRLSANDLSEIYEARADAFEDRGDTRRMRSALIAAGVAHFGAKDHAAAIHAAERALVDGDDPEALEVLVDSQLALGRRDRAREAALRLAPMLLEGPERDRLEALIAEGLGSA